jgi:hypothetical protein
MIPFSAIHTGLWTPDYIVSFPFMQEPHYLVIKTPGSRLRVKGEVKAQEKKKYWSNGERGRKRDCNQDAISKFEIQ